MMKPNHLFGFVAINFFALLTGLLFVFVLGIVLGEDELYVPLVVTFLAAALVPEFVAGLTIVFSQPSINKKRTKATMSAAESETSHRAWTVLVFINTTASLSTILVLFLEMFDKGEVDVVSGFTAILDQFFDERKAAFFCWHQTILLVCILIALFVIWRGARMIARPDIARKGSATLGWLSYVLVLSVVLFGTPWRSVEVEEALVSSAVSTTSLLATLFVLVVAVAALLAVAVAVFSRTLKEVIAAFKRFLEGEVIQAIISLSVPVAAGAILAFIAFWLLQTFVGAMAVISIDPVSPDGAEALERSSSLATFTWNEMWRAVGWIVSAALAPVLLYWTIKIILWILIKVVDILSAILMFVGACCWNVMAWFYRLLVNQSVLGIDWERIAQWDGWRWMYRMRPQISVRQLSLFILALTWTNAIAVDSVFQQRQILKNPFSAMLAYFDDYFKRPVSVAVTPYGVPTPRDVRLCTDMAVAPSWSMESTTRLEFPVAGCVLNESWVNSNGILLIFGVASPEGNAEEELIRARTRALALAQNVQFQTGDALRIYVLNLGKARSSLSFAYGSQMFRPSVEERPILATLFEPTPADWNMSEEDVQNLIAQYSVDADFSNLFSGCELFEFDRQNRSLSQVNEFECN